MSGVNNPALEVRNFREAMHALGYSFTASIEAFCATSPMAMMTNPTAFAAGSDLERAYDRLPEAERRTVYCPEGIAAIEHCKNGPDSWFTTGKLPGGNCCRSGHQHPWCISWAMGRVGSPTWLPSALAPRDAVRWISSMSVSLPPMLPMRGCCAVTALEQKPSSPETDPHQAAGRDRIVPAAVLDAPSVSSRQQRKHKRTLELPAAQPEAGCFSRGLGEDPRGRSQAIEWWCIPFFLPDGTQTAVADRGSVDTVARGGGGGAD